MIGASRLAILKGAAVLLAIVLLASLVAACEGGNDDGGNGDEDGGRADDTALEDLALLAGKAVEGITAKVTYKVTTSQDGETLEGEWVIVRRPPDLRLEILNMEGEVESRTIIITSGDKSYLCFAEGGEENCLVTSAQGTEAQTALLDIPQALAQEAEDVDHVETSQRTIAGLDATCFTVSSALAGLSEGDICFSDEGLLLFLQSEVDDTSSTFEATSVSTEVTDADFEPPYELSELPDFEIPTPSLP